MKPLHVALVLTGVVLAAGLAVEMTQPPPLPAPVPAPKPTLPVPVQVPVRAPAPAPPPPAPDKTQKAQTHAAPRSSLDLTTAAPPAVYKPAPYVEQQPARRKPFPPVAVAKVNPPLLKPAPYEEPPHPAVPRRQVVLQPGMQISVRLNQAVSSDHAVAGNNLTAFLAEPIVADGLIIAERGAHVTVHIVDSQSSSRTIRLGLSDVRTADGQRVALQSEPWVKRESLGNEIVGTIIGAIAGTEKEAARPVNIPPQTLIRFRLVSKVTITERQL